MEPEPAPLAECLRHAAAWHGIDPSRFGEAAEALHAGGDGPAGLAQAARQLGLRPVVAGGWPPVAGAPAIVFARGGGGWVFDPGRGEGGRLLAPAAGGAVEVDERSARRVALPEVMSLPAAAAHPAGAPAWRGREWFYTAFRSVRGELASLLPASILINAFGLVMPLFIMGVYDRVVPNRAVETLWVLAGGVALVFLFDFLMRLARGRLVDAAGKRVDHELATRIHRHVLAIELTARPASAGSFAGLLRGYETVREFLSSATLVALVDLPFSLLLLGMVFWLAGPVGWIPLGAALAAITVAVALQPWLAALIRRSYQAGVNRQALIAETANALESIKAANAEHATEARLREVMGEAEASDLAARRVSHLGTTFTVAAGHFATVGVIVACVYRIAANEMSMGAMIACSMIVGRALAPLAVIVSLLLRLQQTRSALAGLDSVMALPRENARALLRARPRHPALAMRQVSFTYPGQPLPCLREVDLALRPGERVGVIGRAGAGKSTLLRLLARLQTPTEGLVLLDGIDIAQWPGAAVREAIGYLPQDGVLLHGSIRDNIVLARPAAGDEEVLQAAARIGLPEWVNQHPAGFGRAVGERGVLLSGGQRQAVLLARCLLARPDVLLLDEPTASLDLATEQRFLGGLRDFLAEDARRSLVLSTHKPALLALVDRVILLDGGRVLADGPRDEVLARLKQAARPNQADPPAP
jgi:ATP-binding cassette, subfamily C, bacterial LapB